MLFFTFYSQIGNLRIERDFRVRLVEHLLSKPRNLQRSGQVFAQSVNTPPKRKYLGASPLRS